MCLDVNIGQFQYTQNEKGEWVYKSIDVKPIKKGKSEYQDKPQYKAIEEFEQSFLDDYDNMLKDALKQVNIQLNQYK